MHVLGVFLTLLPYYSKITKPPKHESRKLKSKRCILSRPSLVQVSFLENSRIILNNQRGPCDSRINYRQLLVYSYLGFEENIEDPMINVLNQMLGSFTPTGAQFNQSLLATGYNN